ncbi:MAG: MotA/TolQ/ExbB proton channel family protein [Clostridiales Family XIII bacterium]|jgi:biopolymer transport protein ExbB/TolQ|nr:MotA/TolQ/ExbB proton channel family protein [Clostridiales Family XIII bacterium]
MMTGDTLRGALRAISASLEIPVIAVLLFLMAATLFLLGSLLAEVFTERARLKVRLPALADSLRAADADVEAVIRGSGLLKRQKAVLLEVARHPALTPAAREALAVRLARREIARRDGIARISDLIVRLGPMFGLLGTLIPLGPGIIALGRGDTYTLSRSLLVAFDTTVAGLIAAAVAFVISGIRKRWYAEYAASLEMALECLLERLSAAPGEAEAADEAEIR